jgi:hypothetical protein
MSVRTAVRLDRVVNDAQGDEARRRGIIIADVQAGRAAV